MLFNILSGDTRKVWNLCYVNWMASRGAKSSETRPRFVIHKNIDKNSHKMPKIK